MDCVGDETQGVSSFPCQRWAEIEAIRVLEGGIDEEDSLGEVVLSVPRGMWAVKKVEVGQRVGDESAAGRTGECVRLEGILPDYHSIRRTESRALEAP
jgi:hypothetical protein